MQRCQIYLCISAIKIGAAPTSDFIQCSRSQFMVSDVIHLHTQSSSALSHTLIRNVKVLKYVMRPLSVLFAIVTFRLVFIFHKLVVWRSSDISRPDQCHNVATKLSSRCLWGVEKFMQQRFALLTRSDLYLCTSRQI